MAHYQPSITPKKYEDKKRIQYKNAVFWFSLLIFDRLAKVANTINRTGDKTRSNHEHSGLI